MAAQQQQLFETSPSLADFNAVQSPHPRKEYASLTQAIRDPQLKGVSGTYKILWRQPKVRQGIYDGETNDLKIRLQQHALCLSHLGVDPGGYKVYVRIMPGKTKEELRKQQTTELSLKRESQFKTNVKDKPKPAAQAKEAEPFSPRGYNQEWLFELPFNPQLSGARPSQLNSEFGAPEADAMIGWVKKKWHDWKGKGSKSDSKSSSSSPNSSRASAAATPPPPPSTKAASSTSPSKSHSQPATQRDVDAIKDGQRVGSGLKADAGHRAASYVVDDIIPKGGQTFSISSRSGKPTKLTQVEGWLNGKKGIYEWIVVDGKVTHQRFIAGGIVNGVANQKVPSNPEYELGSETHWLFEMPFSSETVVTR